VDGDARYDEGVLVGYRWYDEHGQQPLFPFGHGLSYGEYGYGQPGIEQDEETRAVAVSLEVTDVGRRSGAEAVQLYLAAPAAARQPPRRLKGFAKVQLDPGATTEVCLRLDRHDLAAFDEATWVVHPGNLRGPGRPVVPRPPGNRPVRGERGPPDLTPWAGSASR
jgi:beta-glucosidase